MIRYPSSWGREAHSLEDVLSKWLQTIGKVKTMVMATKTTLKKAFNTARTPVVILNNNNNRHIPKAKKNKRW